MLCFGKSCYYRFNNPTEAKQLKRGLPNGTASFTMNRQQSDIANHNTEGGSIMSRTLPGHNGLSYNGVMMSPHGYQTNTNSNHNSVPKSPLEVTIEDELQEIIRQVSTEDNFFSETYENKYALLDSPSKGLQANNSGLALSPASTTSSSGSDIIGEQSNGKFYFDHGDMKETVICDDEDDGTKVTNDYQPPVSTLLSKYEQNIKKNSPSPTRKHFVTVPTSPRGSLERTRGPPHSPTRIKLGQSSLYSSKSSKSPTLQVRHDLQHSSSGSSISSASLTTVTSTGTNERESSGSDNSQTSLCSSSSSGSDTNGTNSNTLVADTSDNVPSSSSSGQDTLTPKQEVFKRAVAPPCQTVPACLEHLLHNGENIRNTLIVDPDDFDDPKEKELVKQHMLAVSERKNEQKMATMERRRMEEILSICAEYEAKELGSQNQNETGSAPNGMDLIPTSPVVASNASVHNASKPKLSNQHSNSNSNGQSTDEELNYRQKQGPVKIEVSAKAYTSPSNGIHPKVNGEAKANVYYEKLKDNSSDDSPSRKGEISAVQQLLGQLPTGEAAPPKPPRMSVKKPASDAAHELGEELAKVGLLYL